MFSIQELNRFSSTVRRKFAEKLATLPFEVVDRNREASFYSMKNIMLHMIDNEDWMVGYVVRGKASEYSRRKWQDYGSMDSVLEHLAEVERKTAEYLKEADGEKLSASASFRTSAGVDIKMTVEECLLQSFTEQLYHLGELISLLWQEDIEPPTMQWFFNSPRNVTKMTVSPFAALS